MLGILPGVTFTERLQGDESPAGEVFEFHVEAEDADGLIGGGVVAKVLCGGVLVVEVLESPEIIDRGFARPFP